jgi:Metallo-beta-lactamase superfamily
MASPATPTYEILALRYGIFDGRIAAQNYLMPDDHMAPDPLDFLVFAIQGPTGSDNPRTIVMDTGFNPVSAKRRGREVLCTPAEALRNAGIDSTEVRDVVLTHMHWDHAGGMEYFPKAMFHLQESEMAYCTGRCMCQPFLRRPFDVDDVQSAIRALYADRIRFHDGTVEIAPGITLHLIGGHSGGIQSVRVPTKTRLGGSGGRRGAPVGQYPQAQPVPRGRRRRAHAARLRDPGRPRGRSRSYHSGP